MPSLTPYTAIKSKLSELSPGIPVIDDEQVDALIGQNTTPFVAVADAFAEEETQSLGSPQANWLREIGSVEATIYSPSSNSLQTIRTLAETVRDHIRYKVIEEGADKVRVLNVQPPELGEVNDGLWNSMFVLISYEWDYLRATA